MKWLLDVRVWFSLLLAIFGLTLFVCGCIVDFDIGIGKDPTRNLLIGLGSLIVSAPFQAWYFAVAGRKELKEAQDLHAAMRNGIRHYFDELNTNKGRQQRVIEQGPWHYYYSTLFENKRLWVYVRIDFDRVATTECLMADETLVTVSPTHSGMYTFMGCLVRGSLVLLQRLAGGNEPDGITIFPRIDLDHQGHYCGMIYHQTWDSVESYDIAILSRNPLLPGDAVKSGAPVLEMDIPRLDRLWKEGFSNSRYRAHDALRSFAEIENPQFKSYFNSPGANRPINLVCTERRLCADIELKYKGAPWCAKDGKRQPRPKGVESWQAVEDIRAAVYVARSLAPKVNVKIKFLLDSQVGVQSTESVYVYFGGLNAGIPPLVACTQEKLFKLHRGKAGDGGHELAETDWFEVAGIEYKESDHNTDFAIIARVVKANDDGSLSVHFVCAGRTAAGTAAAGWWLAEKWTEMADLYSRNAKALDKHSCVVVIQHPTPSAGNIADQKATLRRIPVSNEVAHSFLEV